MTEERSAISGRSWGWVGNISQKGEAELSSISALPLISGIPIHT
jgi:hypothetical protein